MTATHQIATAIIHQLGGAEFLLRSKASTPMGSHKGVGFRIPKTKGCEFNYVQILQKPNGFFSIDFILVEDDSTFTRISGLTNVPFDKLQVEYENCIELLGPYQIH